MTTTISRIVDSIQAASAGSRNTVHTVPVGEKHVVKSMILRNSRSDGLSLTYSLYIVPSGQTFNENQHRWITDDTLSPGVPKSLDFSMMVLNAGDTVQIKPTQTALYYEAHGMVQA